MKPTNPQFEFGPFRLDSAERLLLRGTSPVPLTPKAFDTLLYLVENNQRLLTKDELIATLWPDSFVEESNLAQHISALRKALGEHGQYIETVPKRGYRFAAEVTRRVEEQQPELAAEQAYSGALLERYEESVPFKIELPIAFTPVATVAEQEPPSGATPPPPIQPLPLIAAQPVRQWEKRRLLAVLLIIAAAGSAFYFLRPAARGPKKLRIAVLPFRNLKPDAQTDFLSFSLADAVITKLNYISALTVRPSAYIDKYRQQQLDPQRVAKELNVDTLLTGTFVKEDDELRVNLQLIDIAANQALWSEALQLRYDKLFTLQDRVTQQVVERLSVKLTPDEAAQIQRAAPREPLAYEYHLRGMDLYWINDLPTASKMLEKSVELDPHYALSWAYLGTVHTAYGSLHFGGRASYERAFQAYDRALALDPLQIEARIFKATLLTDTGRVEEAVPVLREVLRTAPHLAQAHWELAYAYRFGGQIKESIAEGELARQSEDEIKANNAVFNSYLYDGQYSKFVSSLPTDETSAFLTFYRGLGAYYLKDSAQAQQLFNRAFEKNSSLMPVQAGRALSLALAGQTEAGLNLLRGAEKLLNQSGVADAEGIYKIAQAFAVLGDKTTALRLLRRSIEGGFFCYSYFVTDPLLENLRNEAEYAQLLEAARTRHEAFKRRFF